MALACYCEAYAVWVAARDEIEAKGPLCVSASGDQRPHPAVGIMSAAAGQMRAWGAMFGLSPKNRARLELQELQRDPAEALRTLLGNDGGKAAAGNDRGREMARLR